MGVYGVLTCTREGGGVREGASSGVAWLGQWDYVRRTGAIEHLTISLPADVADSMRNRVAAGEFADINAVVLEALLGLEEDEHSRDDGEHDDRVRTSVRAAYDSWRTNPTDVLPLSQEISQAKTESRAGR